MDPVVSGEPAPGGRCKVCGGTLSESLVCQQCGAAFGEANRCPHCRSVADVEPAGALGFRCRVCGGPRIPLDSREVPRTHREVPALLRARKEHVARTAWAVAGGVLAGFGVISLMVTLMVIAFGPGVLVSLGLLGASAIPFLGAALAWRRSKRHGVTRDQLLNDAWNLVASDVLTHGGKEIEADQLARILRIDETRAEQILAQLSAQDLVHARVTDEGDLAYSTRYRVEEPGSNVPPEGAEAADELARARARQ